MKLVRTLLVCALGLALLGAAGTLAVAQKGKDKPKDTKKDTKDTKKDAKDVKVDAGKLVGKWEVTFDSGQLGKGATFEFTKEGKVTVNYTANGTASTIEANYTVDGATITISSDKPKLKETRTVTAFSNKEMETDNSTGGHTKYSKK